MDSARFNSISKLFANRTTRRAAVSGGLGVAAAAFSARATAAQSATPEVDPADPHPSADNTRQKTEFLFVQPFDAGTWAPKAGDDGTYTITLTGTAAQTVYFSDRPERIVGLTPMQQFLDGLGFTPENPPNAAIVAQREGSEEQEILVIELLNPVYDADAATLTYDARVLADYGEHGLAHLARQQRDYELPERFGTGSLFIDDCPTYTCECVDEHVQPKKSLGKLDLPGCYDDDGCWYCTAPQDACAQQWPDECGGDRCAAYCNGG